MPELCSVPPDDSFEAPQIGFEEDCVRSVPSPDNGSGLMESGTTASQEPANMAREVCEDMMHRMSGPNDLQGPSMDIHVAAVLGTGCIECPDDSHHIPFVLEVAAKSVFSWPDLAGDPDGMAAVVTVELCPFLDILPHVGHHREMNPRYASPAPWLHRSVSP